MIRRLKSWYVAYKEALAAFNAGVRDVLFPEGTYWMVRDATVSCASPG